MPLPLESGVQKDLSWPAMYAIEFTNFRPEIFPDLFARYVFWLSYYAPSQRFNYNIELDLELDFDLENQNLCSWSFWEVSQY